MKHRTLYMFGLCAASFALLARPALAEGFELKLGGYYNSIFYNIDTDVRSDATDSQFKEDAEIHFKGKTESENGVTFGFEVQLEAATHSDQIDEHYIYVQGKYGKLEVGAENSTAYKLQVMTPRFLGWKDWDNNFKTWDEVSTYDKPQHDGVSKDANKINYYTPRFNGFQFGLSFTPDSSEGGGHGGAFSVQDDGGFEVLSYGANLKTELAGGVLKLSITAEDGDGTEADEWVVVTDDQTDPPTTEERNGIARLEREELAYGIHYKYGRFEIGMISFTQEDMRQGGDPDEEKNNEFEAMHYAISYDVTDGTTLGIGFHDQEIMKGGVVSDETDLIFIGGHTRLTKGVKLTYSIEEIEASGEAYDGDSTFLGLGLLLKF